MGVFANAILTRMAVARYIVHVTRVCRTRSASRLSRPGAGYPLSEGSGAKFEVSLGIATTASALRAELWVRISDARWRPAVRGKICVYGLCMGFGVHTALINLHPVSGSVEDGFKLCRMYRS